MEFHPKIFKLKNFLIWFMYINIIHHKKNSPKNSIHNFSFEICIQIFQIYDGYYFVMNILHTFKFFNVCWIFQNNWLDEI